MEGSTYDPEQDRTHDQAGIGCWTCKTHSGRAKIEVIMGDTRQHTAELAVYYCVREDGIKEECVANLACEFGDDAHHPGPTQHKPFYDFARGMNGYGYCYSFDAHKEVLNGGRPVANANCNLSKTYYDFGVAPNGVRACYQWSPYQQVLNDGKWLDPLLCRKGDPTLPRE